MAGGLRKHFLTSGVSSVGQKYGKAPAAARRAVVLFDMAFGVQFILKLWMAYQMKALTQHYKMRMRIIGFKYLIGEEF